MSTDAISKGGIQPVGTTHRDFGIDQTGSSNNIQSTPPSNQLSSAQNVTPTENTQPDGIGKNLNVEA